jgi:hypothetical protein
MKENYNKFKREENILKKYFSKFKRLESLNETFTKSLEDTLIKAGSCDYGCAVSCIRPKLGFEGMVGCMNSTC